MLAVINYDLFCLKYLARSAIGAVVTVYCVMIMVEQNMFTPFLKGLIMLGILVYIFIFIIIIVRRNNLMDSIIRLEIDEGERDENLEKYIESYDEDSVIFSLSHVYIYKNINCKIVSLKKIEKVSFDLKSRVIRFILKNNKIIEKKCGKKTYLVTYKYLKENYPEKLELI